MAHTKRASKRRRGRRALNILGAAGASFALGGAASATMPVANVPSLDNVPRPEIGLDEEEISDVTLGTFYVFVTELFIQKRTDWFLARKPRGRRTHQDGTG